MGLGSSGMCGSLPILSLRMITVLWCVGELGDEQTNEADADLTGLRRTIVDSAIDRSKFSG